jgi:glucokinase
MARRSLGRDDPTTTANDEVAAAFRAGDPWVTDALRPGIGHLGRALASVHLAIGVEQFVLVGGFALALGDRYRRLVCAAADRSSWDLGQTWDEMVALGADDDNHGMIGAGLYAAGMVGR